MAKLLDNCFYDKVKILHELSALAWFVEHHAKTDAQNKNNKECLELFTGLEKVLEAEIAKLKKMVCSNQE